jgi:hypothetical protein
LLRCRIAQFAAAERRWNATRSKSREPLIDEDVQMVAFPSKTIE